MKRDSRIGFAMKAVVLKNDEVLLLHKSPKEDVNPKTWDLPGGRVEFGEDPIKGLLREVKEEAGLTVRPVEPLSVWNLFKKAEDFQLIGVNYLCKWKKGEIRVSEEHDFGKWVGTKELLESEKYLEWIKEIVSKLSEA